MNGDGNEQSTASVLGKNVRLYQPYRPKRGSVGRLVGRESELCKVAAAWVAGRNRLPLAPLLVGQPGVGKNRLVYEIAEQTGKDLYIFQGHDDVAAEELACSVRFSDEDSRRMEYTVSPLVTAMHLGQICFIDEIAKIRPRSLALLVSVLDERRYIDSTLLGGRVVAAQGFRFIAATNTADLEGNAMPAFLRSRLHPIIQFGYPAREEIEKIVTDQFLLEQQAVHALLCTFWDEWGKLGVKRNPSPRDAIAIFSLAASHASHDGRDFPDAHGEDPLLVMREPELAPQHVVTAISDMKLDFGWE